MNTIKKEYQNIIFFLSITTIFHNAYGDSETTLDQLLEEKAAVSQVIEDLSEKLNAIENAYHSQYYPTYQQEVMASREDEGYKELPEYQDIKNQEKEYWEALQKANNKTERRAILKKIADLNPTLKIVLIERDYLSKKYPLYAEQHNYWKDHDYQKLPEYQALKQQADRIETEMNTIKEEYINKKYPRVVLENGYTKLPDYQMLAQQAEAAEQLMDDLDKKIMLLK